MSTEDDIRAQVRDAHAAGRALRIVGGDSKAFLGRPVAGEVLRTAGLSGIVEYEPEELVITAHAGTPLAELETALRERGQMLPFEPPHFGPAATVGGMIACGLSGPRRPYAGAVRDYVLGVRIVDGRGQMLHFGGKVMKNVAGYDLSRLMAGAFGTLGVILEVSLKIMPYPIEETTLIREVSGRDALDAMNRLAAEPSPLSAACHDGERLFLRLSGAVSAVAAARRRLGGEPLAEATQFWESVREHRHGFFQGEAPLWRLSVPPAAAMPALPGKWFLDWGGAQRWLRTQTDADAVRRAAEAAGGHATLFRGGDRTGAVFHPLAPPLLELHRRLKAAFDPKGILNPGRLYPEC